MTTATSTRPTSADLLTRLEELRALATEVVVAEERLAEAARDSAWNEGANCLLDAVPGTFYDATRAEIGNALVVADGTRKKEAGMTSLDVCQEVQDAIDVLKFAIERGDDAS